LPANWSNISFLNGIKLKGNAVRIGNSSRCCNGY